LPQLAALKTISAQNAKRIGRIVRPTLVGS
jgi:hypothetical protein